MQRLKCDRCGMTYTDKASIDSAVKMSQSWIGRVKFDGDEPRGIAPCPIIPCEGELILELV